MQREIFMKNKKLLFNLISCVVLLSMVGCAGNTPVAPSGDSTAPSTSEGSSSTDEGSPSISEDSSSGSESSSSQPIDYGSVTIADIEVAFMNEVIINPVFEKEEYEEDLSYTFEGNNISITEGKVKGLVPGTVTAVVATSEHFNTSFNVTVKYDSAALTHPQGYESKYTAPVPNADRYLLHFDVECETVVDAYTRLSSFAFNANNNSWYNMEMEASGNIHLFAKFNGIEKYWNYLGHRSELVVDGKIQYKVDIMKDGQATYFLFNGKVVCGYTEEEMNGYPTLTSMEVTAAADRDNAGLYKINLKNVYYELEDSQNYQDLYTRKAHDFGSATLEYGEAGNETAFRFGSVVLFEDMVLNTDVDVETYAANRTRLAAFAFNRSDNSWYNIEMGDDGVIYLYGHFNNVEKYWIRLAHKDEVTENGHIKFNLKLMKEGQATWFFFNDKLVCYFTEKEVQGYAKLELLEVTATTIPWGGGAYKIHLSNMLMENRNSETYAACMAKVYGEFPDATLTNASGLEEKAPELPVTDYIIFSARVVVTKDAAGWFRPSAFAFNDSDYSWFNIETDAGGDMTLFARFNTTEKYWIPLGTKADTTVDGVFAYDVVILKQGQATSFFYNGELKCSFTVEEVGDYAPLNRLNITASADRSGSEYGVQIQNQKIENKDSAKYAEYLAKIA